MNDELLNKARAAKSPEEIAAVMKNSGVEDFSAEAAQKYYDFLNRKSGELSDDELENASGGCKTINGKPVVTCDRSCHCGKWANAYDCNGCIRKDYEGLRKLWYYNTTNTRIQQSPPNKCGTCLNLGFTPAGIGYCEVG